MTVRLKRAGSTQLEARAWQGSASESVSGPRSLSSTQSWAASVLSPAPRGAIATRCGGFWRRPRRAARGWRTAFHALTMTVGTSARPCSPPSARWSSVCCRRCCAARSCTSVGIQRVGRNLPRSRWRPNPASGCGRFALPVVAVRRFGFSPKVPVAHATLRSQQTAKRLPAIQPVHDLVANLPPPPLPFMGDVVAPDIGPNRHAAALQARFEVQRFA